MSKIEWSPYFYIKEECPWPDAVHVMRGDERKLYLMEQTCNVTGCGYHQSCEIKVWWYSLTCGHGIYLMENDGDTYLYGNGDTYPYGKFCPVCGARITHKGVEE